MKKTQRQQVLEMLRAGPKTSVDFYAAFIPRFSARIWELKNYDGFDIRDETFVLHGRPYKKYTLVEGQGRLF